ncbi:MAG TPA: outer membrane protein assembly factor BamB [Marinagarivorans sp.]
MRSLVKVGLLTVALGVLAGCTAKDASLVPADLKSIEATASIKSRWHTSLDGNARISGIGPFKSGRVYSRPMFGGANYNRFYMVQTEDTLYAVTRRGAIFAVDKEKGKTVWRASISDDISAGLSLQDGVLYTATLNGEVFAVSQENGEILWSANVSTEVLAPPQSNGREVLVSAIDGRLFAFNAENGVQLWNYDHPQPLLTFRAQAAPLILENQAFVAFDNGQLLSFGTREGELRWSVRVSQPQGVTELERAVDLDVTPLASGPFILSAGANGRVVAVSRGTGKISWAEEASVFNEMVANDDAVFYSDETSHVYARRITSGHELWHSKDLHRRDIGPPALLGDTLLVIDSANFLHAFDVKTGQLVARSSLLGNGYGSPMLVDGDTVYVLADNGALSAYRVQPK